MGKKAGGRVAVAESIKYAKKEREKARRNQQRKVINALIRVTR